MENEETNVNIITPTNILIAGTAIFGAYQLGKLGLEWTKVGVSRIKNRKSNEK